MFMKILRGIVAARFSYVLGALCFAAVAMGLTAQVTIFGWLFVCSVLLPTALVAAVASLTLVSGTRVANIWAWLLAGVIVPIAAVFGFVGTNVLATRVLAGYWSPLRPYWLVGAVGITIAVPVGVIGHLVVRWLIKSRFYSPKTPGKDRGGASA